MSKPPTAGPVSSSKSPSGTISPRPALSTPISHAASSYSGDAPDSALAPIYGIGDPIANVVTSKPYVAQQLMLDANEPKGRHRSKGPHRYWKTEYIPELPDGFLSAFREGGLAVTSPLFQGVIFHLGGALNERSADDGAADSRDAQFINGFSGT